MDIATPQWMEYWRKHPDQQDEMLHYQRLKIKNQL